MFHARSGGVVLVCLAFALLVPNTFGVRLRNDLDGDCIPTAAVPKDFSFFPDDFRIKGVVAPTELEIEVAEDFSVVYGENFKVVKNLRVNETYVLYQCGTPAPDADSLPENAKVFEIPLTSVSVVDTTFIEFMELLGVEDRTAYASQFSTAPCFQKISGCGKVAQDPVSDFADKELVAVQNVETDVIIASSANSDEKSIAFTATSDPAVLKRAEWIKFASLFFNKEVAANGIFDGIQSLWERLSTKGENKEGPTVAWIGFQDFAGSEFFIHAAPFKTEYILAAGGRPLDLDAVLKIEGVEEARNGAKIPFEDLTEGAKILQEMLADADIVIDETFDVATSDYTIEKFKTVFEFGEDADSEFAFLANKKVFRLDGRVSPGTFSEGLDWFETAVARPDLVLLDLLDVVGSERASSEHKRIWFRNIAEGESTNQITKKSCKAVRKCAFKQTKPICPSVVVSCDGTLSFRQPEEETCPAPDCGKD